MELFVDGDNANKIFEIIQKNNNRFKRALYEMLLGRYNNDLYGKENVSPKTKYVTAIKFKKRGNANLRIYCIEIFKDLTPNYKRIIMVDSYHKKTNKIDKKLKNFIENIGTYEYTFE
ncbi:MAG: hypothetical protein GXO89_00925 [Chlorobi bacterium]|nr:hypothetical protein [Chlorobiota bacterium]